MFTCCMSIVNFDGEVFILANASLNCETSTDWEDTSDILWLPVKSSSYAKLKQDFFLIIRLPLEFLPASGLPHLAHP